MAKAAKKPGKEAETVEVNDDPRASVVKSVAEEYGKGVIVSGNDIIEDPCALIPISPSLDIITGGGILEGSFVGLTGPPKSTKTTSALSFLANCQLPQYGSRPVFYGKVEGRLSTQHLQGIRGLDLDNFKVIQSREGQILSAQKYLQIFDNILTNIPRAVLLIDSISALCDQKELDGGVGTETRGSGAKLFSQWLSTMSNVVPVNRSIVIGITHMMCNTSGVGPKYLEKASRRWHYQCDYQLRTIMKENWMGTNQILGFKVAWKCFTTPRGLPLMQTDSYFRFGVGLDRLYEAFSYGCLAGLIKKTSPKSSWMTIDFLMRPEFKHIRGDLTEAPKAQGGEGIYKLLEANPEWAHALQDEVVKIASGFGRWGDAE